MASTEATLPSPWLDAARSIQDELVAWRRHLHRHPEVSFQEHQTTAYLAAEVERMGLTPIRRTPTGLWLDIDGGAEGPLVLVRADIDALPVREATGLAFASENDGAMHACGHDTHMAMALGVIRLLVQHRERIHGRVRVLFQPAEETPPGGAPQMIEAGVLEGVAAAIGQHVFALGSEGVRETGKAYIASGPVMAASGRFFLNVRGRGGHGSAPHLSVDAIAVTGEVIGALQHIVARHLDPQKPAVVTVGTIHGGFNQNVIAPEVEMTGTVRTFDPAVEERLVEHMRTIVTHTAAAFGGEVDLRYEKGYPVVVNDPATTAVMRDAAEAVLGPQGVEDATPLMGSEDFAYYAHQVPSSFLWLGAGNPAVHPVASNHDPHFAPDEAALPFGAAILTDTALRLLERHR
jgi:amidohydrolase